MASTFNMADMCGGGGLGLGMVEISKHDYIKSIKYCEVRHKAQQTKYVFLALMFIYFSAFM